MKSQASTLAYAIAASSLLFSQASHAQCDINTMDADTMAECITIEGSGANYQDWLVQYHDPSQSTDYVQEESHEQDGRGVSMLAKPSTTPSDLND